MQISKVYAALACLASVASVTGAPVDEHLLESRRSLNCVRRECDVRLKVLHDGRIKNPQIAKDSMQTAIKMVRDSAFAAGDDTGDRIAIINECDINNPSFVEPDQTQPDGTKVAWDHFTTRVKIWRSYKFGPTGEGPHAIPL